MFPFPRSPPPDLAAVSNFCSFFFIPSVLSTASREAVVATAFPVQAKFKMFSSYWDRGSWSHLAAYVLGRRKEINSCSCSIPSNTTATRHIPTISSIDFNPRTRQEGIRNCSPLLIYFMQSTGLQFGYFKNPHNQLHPAFYVVLVTLDEKLLFCRKPDQLP